MNEFNAFPGMSMEDTYINSRKKFYSDFAKKFPVLHKLVFGKKYILPNYRRPDYHHAEACDYLLVDSLFGYLDGSMPIEDHVSGHCTSNFVESWHYGRPTFWLEKELGFPLVKTPLPLDYYVTDINWRWPSFRVYLPKGLLALTRDGGTSYMMFLDICHIDSGSKTDLPKEVHMELTKVLGRSGQYHKIPLRTSTFEGMCVTGFFTFDGPESALAYAASCRLEQETIQQLMAQVHEPLMAPLELDVLDHEFNNRMLALAINILLYLSTLPLEYQPKELPAIRKPHQEGQRLIPGLYPAKFIGQSQIRPTRKTGPSIPVPSGKHLAPHWRAGHWKRQPYGPKQSLRKLIWIGIYHTGHEEDDAASIVGD